MISQRTYCRDDFLIELTACGYRTEDVEAAMTHLESEYSKIISRSDLSEQPLLPQAFFEEPIDACHAPIAFHLLKSALGKGCNASFSDILKDAVDFIAEDPRSGPATMIFIYAVAKSLGIYQSVRKTQNKLFFRVTFEGETLQEKKQSKDVGCFESEFRCTAWLSALAEFSGLPPDELLRRLQPENPDFAKASLVSWFMLWEMEGDSIPAYPNAASFSNENFIQLMRSAFRYYFDERKMISNAFEAEDVSNFERQIKDILGFLDIALENHRLDTKVSADIEEMRAEALGLLNKIRKIGLPERKPFPEKPEMASAKFKKKKAVS